MRKMRQRFLAVILFGTLAIGMTFVANAASISYNFDQKATAMASINIQKGSTLSKNPYTYSANLGGSLAGSVTKAAYSVGTGGSSTNVVGRTAMKAFTTYSATKSTSSTVVAISLYDGTVEKKIAISSL